MATVIIENRFGKLTGWNRLTFNVLGRDLEGINRVSYGDSVTKTNAYGAGRMPVGREEGQYECKEVVLGLFQEEVRALMASLKPGMRIQDIEPFDGVCEYELPNGTILRDRIVYLEFTDNSVDVKQGDGKIVTEYKMIASHVNWNTI